MNGSKSRNPRLQLLATCTTCIRDSVIGGWHSPPTTLESRPSSGQWLGPGTAISCGSIVRCRKRGATTFPLSCAQWNCSAADVAGRSGAAGARNGGGLGGIAGCRPAGDEPAIRRAAEGPGATGRRGADSGGGNCRRGVCARAARGAPGSDGGFAGGVAYPVVARPDGTLMCNPGKSPDRAG